MEEAVKTMPKLADSQSWANSKYYKGGFDPKMNKREAALILGKLTFIIFLPTEIMSVVTSIRLSQFKITYISRKSPRIQSTISNM